MINADSAYRRGVCLLCVVIAVLVLGGCRGGEGRPARVDSGTAVTDPAPTCDPRASLRPRGPLPQPGHMPAGTPMASIFQRGRLIVGIDQDAYLFSFRDRAGGRMVGFEIDIVREIARAIFGDPDAVQFRAITTAERIPVLQRGEVDMVVRTMTMNCQRRQQVAFSTEYLSSGQRLLVRRDSGIRDLADLGSRKVCATNGSSSIPNIQRATPPPVAVATDILVDCLVLLQQHQVDAVSSIDTLLAALVVQDPSSEIVGRMRTDDPPASPWRTAPMSSSGSSTPSSTASGRLARGGQASPAGWRRSAPPRHHRYRTTLTDAPERAYLSQTSGRPQGMSSC